MYILKYIFVTRLLNFVYLIEYVTFFGQVQVMERDQEDSPLKKSRSWPFEYLEEKNWSMCKVEEHKTLELFPLHPEGR